MDLPPSGVGLGVAKSEATLDQGDLGKSTDILGSSVKLHGSGEMVIVGRRGSFIPIGESLREAAEKVNMKAMKDRIHRMGDDFKHNVGIAKLHHEAEGAAVVDFGGMGVDMGHSQIIASGGSQDISEKIRANLFKEPEKPGASNSSEQVVPADKPIVKEEFTVEKYVDSHIAKLDVSRILITSRKPDIVREKTKLIDLKERERVINNILKLQREISETVLESQKAAVETQNLEQSFDVVRKEHEEQVVDFEDITGFTDSTKS
ncbi:hypothetical protein HDU97_008027 [Phlyctochytrium planicorne]|nr:hypothetical protein HDU97_008027 [Phlyctochytrium planicorne]